jgi:hypothetical protein
MQTKWDLELMQCAWSVLPPTILRVGLQLFQQIANFRACSGVTPCTRKRRQLAGISTTVTSTLPDPATGSRRALLLLVETVPVVILLSRRRTGLSRHVGNVSWRNYPNNSNCINVVNF